jgi:predicted enzyme related to lactoylglutathione lyase
MPGAPIWIDLAVADPAAATEFYGTVFGWTAEPMGGAWRLLNGDRAVGSMAENSATTQRPDGWLVFLLAPDVDSTSLAAHSNGGDVYGRHDEMVTIKDSQDALVGAWNPGEHKAFLYSDETGMPVWHELHAADYDAALEFYENVFEWEPQTMGDTPEFRYSTLGSGRDAVAGLFDAKADLGDLPTHWKVYVAVDDANARRRASPTINGMPGPRVQEPVPRRVPGREPREARRALPQGRRGHHRRPGRQGCRAQEREGQGSWGWRYCG